LIIVEIIHKTHKPFIASINKIPIQGGSQKILLTTKEFIVTTQY